MPILSSLLRDLEFEFTNPKRSESSKILNDWTKLYGQFFFRDRGALPSFTNETEMSIAIELLEREPGWRMRCESNEFLRAINDSESNCWIAEVGVCDVFILESGVAGVTEFIRQAPICLQPLLRTDGFVISSSSMEWAVITFSPKFILKFFFNPDVARL